MSRRKIVFSLASSSSSSLSTIPLPTYHFFRKNKFCTTSTSDNLDGLIDPHSDFLRADSFTSPAGSFSADEFKFLRDTFLDPVTDSKQNIESGQFFDDAVLILDTIQNCNDGFGDKTHKFLRQFREKLNESLVVDVLNSLKNPELGVKFFIWAGKQIGYSHTAAVYNALIDVLGCRKNDRILEHFLHEIKNHDKEILGKLLNFYIRNCCRNGLWNIALEELGRLKDFGYKPSRTTYNALIHVFLKANRLDTAYLVHKEMSDLGFNMDESTLGCYAHSLCKVGRWREALALIEKEEFLPDTIMYTMMISGLCKASLLEEAMDFLNKMRSSSCLPNVVTYRIILCACLNKKQLGRCKRILSMMITEGCYPSPKIYNSLVHAFCKQGDYSYAYKLIKKMVNCGCKPGYVVYNILIGGICGNEKLPSSEALDLAEKASNEMLSAGLVLNKINVSNFARCLCGAGKFEEAYNIIHEMMSKGFIPDTSTYSKVIGFLCNAAKVEKAFLLFKEMKSNGVVYDVFTYTVLIDSFCKAGLIQQGKILFDEMIRDGCSPNVVTYTALIHAYLKAKNVSGANELFEMMLSEGCDPNIVTYTALIDGHCKAGNIEKACQIFLKMKGNKDVSDIDMYFKVDDSNDREPNVFTYGALVDGLCKSYKVKKACDLLNSMSEEGYEPNHIVYDALIDGFCKVGKLDEVQVVLKMMSRRGYSPSIYTYSSLIDRMLKDKKLDLALQVLSKMLENSCVPNVIIYTEMVDGLCKVGKTDEAYKLMLMMEEKGCLPNVVTYTAMIDGFGKIGKTAKCLEIFNEMGVKGCAPNFVTYKVLINHCCASGLLDEAHKLLEEMKQIYWPKDISGHKKVIKGFEREFIISLGLLEEMGKQNNSAPIIPVYKILIDSFNKAGKIEMALELHNEISSSSEFSASLMDTYSSLIESLSLANMVDKAFELYADMINKGVVPDLCIMFHLINGLIRDGRWEDALQLSDSMCQMVQATSGNKT